MCLREKGVFSHCHHNFSQKNSSIPNPDKLKCWLFNRKIQLLDWLSSEATEPTSGFLLTKSQGRECYLVAQSTPTVNYYSSGEWVMRLDSYTTIHSLLINSIVLLETLLQMWHKYPGTAFSSTLVCCTAFRDRRYDG